MTLYRYEDEGYFSLDDIGDSERRVSLKAYPVIKETAKGVWINISFVVKPKWVSLHSKKRYAYPSLTEAKFNFLKRKQSQVAILEEKLIVAKKGLKLATDLWHSQS